MQLNLGALNDDDDEIRYEFFDALRQEKDPRFSPRHEMKTALKWTKEYYAYDPGMAGNNEVEYDSNRGHLKYENLPKQPVDPYLEDKNFPTTTRSILGRAGFESGRSSLSRGTRSRIPSRKVRRKKKKPLKPKTPFDLPNTRVNDLYTQSLLQSSKVNLLGLKDDSETKEGDEEDAEDDDDDQVVIKLGSYDRISLCSHKGTGVELMVPPLAINQYQAGKVNVSVPSYLQLLALPKLPIGKRCIGPTVQITPLEFSEFFKPLHAFLPHSSAIDFTLDDEDVQVLVCDGSRGASWVVAEISEHMPAQDCNVWQSFLTDEEKGYAAIDDNATAFDDDFEDETKKVAPLLGPCGSATAVERGVVVKLERCCYARVVQSVPLADYVCVCVYMSDLYKPKTGRTVSMSLWVYADRPDQHVKQKQLEAESRQGNAYWAGYKEVGHMRGMVLNYGQRTRVFTRGGGDDGDVFSEEFEWRGKPVQIHPEMRTPMRDELTDRMYIGPKLARCETTIEFMPLLDKEEKQAVSAESDSNSGSSSRGSRSGSNSGGRRVSQGIGRGGGRRGEGAIPKVIERSSRQEPHYGLSVSLEVEVPTYIT
jgi:hypothetical protein